MISRSSIPNSTRRRSLAKKLVGFSAVTALALIANSCMLYGGDTMHCGNMQTIELEQSLNAESPEFVLTTGPGGATIAADCSVFFTFEVALDSAEGTAWTVGNLEAIPVAGIADSSIFKQDDSITIRTNWKSRVQPVFHSEIPNRPYYRMTAERRPPRGTETRQGSYSVRTRYLADSTDGEGTMHVRASLTYYDGGPRQ